MRDPTGLAGSGLKAASREGQGVREHKRPCDKTGCELCFGRQFGSPLITGIVL